MSKRMLIIISLVALLLFLMPSAISFVEKAIAPGLDAIKNWSDCNWQISKIPVHKNPGVNNESAVAPSTYSFIAPWEQVYINGNTNLMFGPNTLVIYYGDLDHISSVKMYRCTNGRFFDVFGTPSDYIWDPISYLEVRKNKFGSRPCYPNWDCTLPITYVIIENDVVVETGPLPNSLLQ